MIQRSVQLILGADVGSVNAEKDVPGDNPHIGGAAALGNGGDIQPGGQAVIALIKDAQALTGDTQKRSAGHIALVENLGYNVLYHRTGDGEAQPLHPGTVGKGTDFGGIDADDLPAAVNQRAAGIAGVQGGIGLNQVHGAPVHIDIPVDGGNNAVGHGAPELHAQGVADCHHTVPHIHVVRVAEFRRGQIRGIHLQHGQVAGGVAAHQPRRLAALVCQKNGVGFSVFNHMIIGDHIAVL